MSGWIKLHRRLLDNAVASSPSYGWLWVTLLLLANHEDKSFIWNKQKMICKAGQILTGRNALASQTGISATTVERILTYLESEHQIGQQKTSKFRLITILKWDEYQIVDSSSDNRRTTDGQQTDTNKNVRIKEEETTSLVVKPPTIKATYGNKNVNRLIDSLKTSLGIAALDGTIQANRNSAFNAIRKLTATTKDEERSAEFIEYAIQQAAQDNWHSTKMTSMRYIEQNVTKLVLQFPLPAHV